MDVLADLLLRARARGALFARSRLHGDSWGIEFPDDAEVVFHGLLEGEAWLTGPDGQRVRMLQGDVALVRRGGPHTMTSGPDIVPVPLGRFVEHHAVSTGPRSFELAGPGVTTELMCGAYTFEGSICDTLLDALPPVVLIPAGTGSLRAVVAMLAQEVARDAPGQQTVLDRLLDLALVFALRTHFATAGDSAPPWYQALDDPVAGPALRAIHDDPSRPWTVESLAAVAAMSRAAFARRFKAATGDAPLTYLSNWRMSIAAEALQRPSARISDVAREIGYSSEFAFAAAFKRHHGEPPGRFRSRLA